MQRFTCPHCGLRDEQEFHYLTEPKPRPPVEVEDAAWGQYLYFENNDKGAHRELYRHLCGTLVLVERDSVTHRLICCRAAREGGA